MRGEIRRRKRGLRAFACLVVSVGLSACGGGGGGREGALQDPELQRLWTLTGVSEAGQSTLLPDTEYAVDFSLGGSEPGSDPPRHLLSLRVGCNTCTGSYAIAPGGGIDITVGPCTDVACIPFPRWASDLPYYLGQAQTYVVAGNTLTLRCGDPKGASASPQLSFVDGSRLPPGTVPLASGPWSEITEERFALVADMPALEALWEEHCPQGTCGESLPVVDFTDHEVLALFAGQKPSGGYRIGVDGITAQAAGTRVDVALLAPGAGCAAAAVITAPYAIVQVPALPEPVTFHLETRGVPCR